MPSLLGRIGLVFLLVDALVLTMVAGFPMDPASTPRGQMSFSGKMHGVLFLIGVPCQLLATLLLSLAAGSESTNASIPLLLLTALIWLSFVTMIAIMVMVGPGKPSNPNGPERFLGLPNRLFMIAYGVWLMVAAWPMPR
jgi:hypothetical protein